MRRAKHFPVTALVILLSACGGGGDGAGTAVSSSPAPALTPAPASTPANTQHTNPATADSGGTGNTQTAGNTSTSTTTPSTDTTTTPSPLAEADTGTTTGGATQAPSTPAPVPAPVPTPVVAPLSDKGVRGDVLLAMFEQYKCGAGAWQATSYNGRTIREVDTPEVRFYASLVDANNYTEDPNQLAPIDFYYMRGECYRYFYKPVSAGTYSYTIKTLNHYFRVRDKPMFGEAWLKRGFNDLTVSYTITVGNGQFQIGPSIRVESTEDLGHQYQGDFNRVKGQTDRPFFKDSRALSIKMDEEVPYGVLNEWNIRRSPGPDSFNRLMLVKSDIANQAKLCTNVEVAYAKRMVCTVWNIPNGWQWGQELEYVDGYIIDDRSVYPGESGFLFWRNQLDYGN